MKRFRGSLAVGSRLHLRPLRRRDRDTYLEVARSSRHFHRPFVQLPLTRDGFTAWFRAPGGERVRLLAIDNREPRLLGYVALNDIVRGDLQGAHLGYWVAADAAGQGVGTEILSLALRYGFQGLRLHRLEANVQPGNLASIALVRRCGFRREGLSPRYLKIAGRWRDHERFALTAEEWKRSRSRARSAR